MAQGWRRSVALMACLAFALSSGGAFGLIHNLEIREDSRSRFFIENFGFEAGGVLSMKITNFSMNGLPARSNVDVNDVGFVVKLSEVDSSGFLEESSNACPLSDLTEDDQVVGITDSAETIFTMVVELGKEGFYNTYFVSCSQEEKAEYSFDLELVQYNVRPNGEKSFLSAGRAPLPTLFGVMIGFYVVMLLVWVIVFLRGHKATTNRIHHLMTLLVALKMFSLVFKTIDYHYQDTSGSAGGWGIVYYLFAGAKGLLMFVLIALIGTGWKFVKPFLSEKDKRIFMIVIPLQLLDNLALIVIEETAPGSQGFLTWKDIFRVVDIICCGAILIPIIWSIKHLREASQIDGKAAKNLNKLKLFRQFYLMVVSYIYFTRIIIYLLDATLPFRFVWLGDFFTELATVIFFGVTGYMFRPGADNPYFKLDPEDVELEGSASGAETAPTPGGNAGGAASAKGKGSVSV